MHVHARTAACLSLYAPLACHPPAYRDWLDYVIVEDGRDVGRLYEDRHSKPELRWFWSITVTASPRSIVSGTAGMTQMFSCGPSI